MSEEAEGTRTLEERVNCLFLYVWEEDLNLASIINLDQGLVVCTRLVSI